MVEFKKLNTKEKSDYFELLCWLSARANGLDDDPSSVPERTEDEILENASENTLECWEEFLISKIGGK